MFKKIIVIFFLALLLWPLNYVFAQDTTNNVNIYLFWGEGCPHCSKEKIFLEELENRYPQVKVRDFEVWSNRENRRLLSELGKKLNVNISGVPVTIIGEKSFIGWHDEQSTGLALEEAVKCVLQNGCYDIAGETLASNGEEQEGQKISPIPPTIKVPILGEIKIKNFSLPLLTVVLGALDGFNPCAMWTLLFLLSLLLGMEDRGRMWVLGTAFIAASASVYFLFMAAWLNLILFLGFVIWIRIIIGLIALAGGGYNLKEYFTDHGDSCKVTGTEKRQKIFAKLKAVTQQKNFYLALGGIIILAFAVNLVELVCSAGLPAVYTQTLAMSNLAKWQYYLYILFYIFFFMLDDLIVFLIAMTTLQATGIGTKKYARFSHLVGGILMLIIGLILIFKPSWLMFG